MFTKLVLSSHRCIRFVDLSLCHYVPIVSLSSISGRKLESTMEQLMNSKRYADVLNAYYQKSHSPTDISATMALKACTKLCDYPSGIRIHQELSTKSLRDPFIQTSLIHFYMQCGDIDRAEKIFLDVDRKTVHMYGAILKGYLSNNLPEKVLKCFNQILFKPNEVIITILFNACAKLANDQAKTIGEKVIDQLPDSFLNDQILMTAAIDMFMKFGNATEAQCLFQSLRKKSIVTYGAMMRGYVLNALPEKALELFETMPFKPNEVLYAIAYSACASLSSQSAVQLGEKLLQQMPKTYFNDVVLLNSAAHMLMKFGYVEQAERLISQIKKPDIMVYGVLMKGYNINQQPQKSLQILEEIHRQKISLDEPASVLLINACSQLGFISICQRVIKHIPLRFFTNAYVTSSLIDMWGKVGIVDEAKKIWETFSQRDVYNYTTMINAYGRNGRGAEAVDLYRQMPDNMRNVVSHVCVLHACSHAGLVDEAKSIFGSINDKTEQIITVMVDCFSRMFIFDQAQALIDQYEKASPPSPVMYSARNHHQSDLSQRIYDRMRLLFPDKKSDLIAASILLSNTYSSLGDYQQAQEIRADRIKHYGSKVKPGLSWTEVNDEIVEFRAHDQSHPRSAEIRAEVDRFSVQIQEYGHQYDSTWMNRPLKIGESIESVLCGHSEKLAIAYNLIQSPSPSPIQVTKNLRICGDCRECEHR